MFKGKGLFNKVGYVGIAGLFSATLKSFFTSKFYKGPASFDSVGGSNDEQTGFAFDTQLFMEARTRTFIGSLSKPNDMVRDMNAGAQSLDGSQCIARKEITEGEEVRYTMQEHMTGVETYGDMPVQRGDFLGYKNQYARVNMIKTPAVPIQGEMAQQRVKKSITDIPASVKNEVIDYTAETMELQALGGLVWGASPSVLLPTSEGGLGVSLGVGAGGGAGVPLMPMHFWTPDTGKVAYSTTVATYNSSINDAINGIDASADDSVSLNKLKTLSRLKEKINFWPTVLNGKKYKAINLCDPDLWYRIDHLLATYYKDARERSANNPIFGITHQLEYLDELFISVPNLEKFRPAYNSGTGIPDFGPGIRGDFRKYTTSSTNALMISISQRALVEGYNGSVRLTKEEGRHEDGLEIAARTKLGYMRGEWYAKDGRADTTNAAVCYSVFVSAFYEPGVGVGY